MRDNITGKSILLVGDNLFGLAVELTKELQKLGASRVIFKQVKFTYSLRNKITIRSLYGFIVNPYSRRAFTEELKRELANEKFDIMLVIKDMPFKKSFFDWMRAENPGIRIILFLWETLKGHMPRYADYLVKPDVVYSFDRNDAKKYGLRYFPDFYIDGRNIPLDNCKYDICFIGSMNSSTIFNRARILNSIDDFCHANGLQSFLYLKYDKERESFVSKAYRLCVGRKYMHEVRKYQNKGFLYDHPLSLEQYNQVLQNSKVIIDINHSNRQGMTINAITAIGRGKKLITTNKYIKQEEFYNPSMIYILDEKQPQMDFAFMKAAYTPVDVSYLRIDNWLLHVVNEK